MHVGISISESWDKSLEQTGLISRSDALEFKQMQYALSVGPLGLACCIIKMGITGPHDLNQSSYFSFQHLFQSMQVRGSMLYFPLFCTLRFDSSNFTELVTGKIQRVASSPQMLNDSFQCHTYY